MVAQQWHFGDELFPLKSKIVPDFHCDEETGVLFLRFHVDPRFPNRWREEPYYSTIKRLSLVGLRDGFEGNRYQTIVAIVDDWTMILPHRECKYSPGIVLPVGEDQFEFVACKDNEAVKKLDEDLQVFWRAGVRARQAHPELAPRSLSPFELMLAVNDPEVRAMMEKRIREAAAKRGAEGQ